MRSSEVVEDVVVVGGGDIGLLTALSLRKFNPKLDVRIVDDFDDDPLEVGKSTYREMTDILHRDLEIPATRFLSEVNPIWKGSVYFRDWCGDGPFHFPFDDYRKYPDTFTADAIDHYYYHYTELAADPDRRTVNEGMVEEGKSPISYDVMEGRYGPYEAFAYQFDTDRFNSFLRTVCEERGVSLVDDGITTVRTDGDRVQSVEGDGGSYEADLFVDATGFGRVIKRELDDTFREFPIPLDSALHAKIERPLSEAVPATVIDSGQHGWFWQIDTYSFRDVGYVFASEFATVEEATSAFVEHCDGAISDGDMRTYEFTSGYYETAWQGNCVTIGNAEGFVEPLQSTGLTANAQSALQLSNVLASQGRMIHEGARDDYNAWVERLWESINDFVSVHYRYASGTGEFWETMRSIPVSPRVETLEEKFDRNGYAVDKLAADNVDNVRDLLVVPPGSFFSIMRSMGARSDLYENNSFPIDDEKRAEVDELYESMETQIENLLTIEEFYKGVLPTQSAGRVNTQRTSKRNRGR